MGSKDRDWDAYRREQLEARAVLIRVGIERVGPKGASAQPAES